MSCCSVCNVEMPKARFHYGGLSCYSCRAFFRRMTQRDQLARCRFDGSCSLDLADRRSCPPCRYDRCLRAGMRPDLVLDDDDKRKRFRKWLPPPSDSESQEQPEPASSVETSSTWTPAETIHEAGDGGETEEDCEEIPQRGLVSTEVSGLTLDLDVENMLAELAQSESFLDPETGEISQPSIETGI